jgi:predicted phosphodiesterase
MNTAETVVFIRKSFNKDVTIIPFGDMHIGSPDTDYDLIDKTIQMIKQTGAGVIGMGDYIENANKYSIGGGVYGQTLTPTEQINEVYRLFYPIKDQLLFLLTGNHEQRTSKHMGVDLTRIIADKLGVPYEGYGNFLTIKAGNNEYKIYATHGSKGARKSHTKLNAVKELREAYNAHVYIMGHLHDLMFDSDQIWDIENDQPVLREKTYILSGHFLGKYNPSSYQQVAAYQPGKCGVPVITLSSKEWNVKVEEFNGRS